MKTNPLIRTLGVLALLTGGLAWAQNSEPTADRATALAEARAGRWERAEPVLESLAAGETPDPEVCATLALRRLDEKRNKEAVLLAERAVQAVPDNAALQALLGRTLGARIGGVAFSHQGELAMRMLAAFQRAEALDPQHVPALIGLANYYLNAPEIAGGSLERAEEYARKVVALDPYDAALLLARVAERRGEWAGAAAQYRQAMVQQPHSAWLQSELGRVLAAAGDPAGARTAYEEALRLDAGCAAARTGLEALPVGSQ